MPLGNNLCRIYSYLYVILLAVMNEILIVAELLSGQFSQFFYEPYFDLSRIHIENT